jgi:ABC-type multidrug transport system fused ATPase/permease subunit
MSTNTSNNATETPTDCADHRYFGLKYTVVMSTLLLLLWIVGILCNGTVFLVIVRTRRLRNSTTNVLVANSSLIGFLFHVFIVPISLWVIINGGNWLSLLCHLAGFLLIVLTLASWLCQAAISVERYIKIMYPLKRSFTGCVSAVVITSIWLFSCGVGLLPQLTSNVTVVKARIVCAPDITDRTSPFMVVYFGVTLLSLVTMVLCQVGVYIVYKRIKRRSQLRTQASGTFVNSSADEVNGLELHRVMNGDENETVRESAASQVSRSDGSDRGIERSDIGITLSIFQGCIFYTVVYVGGIITLLISNAYGAINGNVCKVDGSARFYAASLYILLCSMLLAVVPMLCVRGNADLKGVLTLFLRKLLCLHVRRSVDLQH